MKRISHVVAVCVAMAANVAWAGDFETEARTLRLECESTHMSDPYISVRGSLQFESESGSSQVSGHLRIGLGGGRTGRAYLRGQYIEQGRQTFVILQSYDSSGIEEIYVDLSNGGGLFKSSYVSFRNGSYYRMSCRKQ